MFEGRFSQLRSIGSGAMGKVYRAWDESGKRPVAIKVIEEKDISDRFEREANLLSQIDHPNIVRYIAHGVTREGQPWLAMEWLDGDDLEVCLKKGPLSFDQTRNVAKGVAEGLAWAHARGFVHRDLKPSNVFILGGDYCRIKIVDFGLARRGTTESSITKTGTFMGTVEYTAPEQMNDAKRADSRADVYALGAVLFHCVTGQPPHQGASVVDTVRKRLTEEAPPMSSLRRDVPTGLEAVVASMLRRSPSERPADGAAVLAALQGLEGFRRPLQPLEGIDVEAPTLMSLNPALLKSVLSDAAGSAAAVPPARPSAPVPQPGPLGPKSGTVIIPVQTVPKSSGALPEVPDSARLGPNTTRLSPDSSRFDRSSPGSAGGAPPSRERARSAHDAAAPESSGPSFGARAPHSGDRKAWIGVALLSLVILLAIGIAAWRSLR
jgi:serine/threonine protein kinase